MKKSDKAVLSEGLRKLSALAVEIADQLDGVTDKREEPAPPPVADEPVKAVTLEDVRTILAEKSRTGFRAEVKALLSAHGVRQLSDVTDPAQLSAIVAEAEVIGNG